MKDLCSTFFAFQIGICVFKYDESVKKYIAYPFNFYVFPSSTLKENILTFQSSTLEFLTDNNLDWNKVFKHGIPYTPREKKEELKEAVKKFVCEQTDSEGKFSLQNIVRLHLYLLFFAKF